MSHRIAAVVSALLWFAPALMGGWGTPCETTMTLEPDFGRISSIARCSWETFNTQDNSVTIRIHHKVTPGTTDQQDVCQAPGYCGTTVVVFPYSASTTYTSTATITASQYAFTVDERIVTQTLKTPDPVRPRDDAPDICASQPWRCDPRDREYCPLVVQTGHGPWHFTSVAEGVLFDMNGDGTVEQTAWTAPNSSLAFVAIDLDGDGKIGDARELFGERTLMPDGTAAANGFTAVRQYDVNGDAVIDQRDPVWPMLLLWTDSNHDGKSETSELQPLATTAFRALETGYHELNRRDPNGNVLRFQSLIHDVSGEKRPYYDVFFQTRPEGQD